MTKCVDDGIDLILTIDKNILFQQSIVKYDLSIVVFDAMDSKVSTLIQFLPAFESRMSTFEKRKLYVINI